MKFDGEGWIFDSEGEEDGVTAARVRACFSEDNVEVYVPTLAISCPVPRAAIEIISRFRRQVCAQLEAKIKKLKARNKELRKDLIASR